MSYEEELEKLHRQIDESKISVAEEQEREDSINKDLFRKMERIIKDEKLYLMPELVRQDMLARLSVDKNRFPCICLLYSEGVISYAALNRRWKWRVFEKPDTSAMDCMV